MRRGGFRRRLELAIVGLTLAVGLLLSAAGYLGVRSTLRADLLSSALERAHFAAGVLAVERLTPPVDVAQLEASRLIEDIILRGTDGVFVDLADEPYASAFSFNLVPDAELAEVVDGGRAGAQWVDIDGNPYLVVGARVPETGPSFYFFHDATPVDGPLRRLAQILGAGLVVLVAISAVVARRAARGVLTPVAEAAVVARRMAAGELEVRLDAAGEDEIAEWAASFNSMADSLQSRIEALARSDAFQRRFVSDVAHELRTPLTALVAEAEVLSRHLDGLAPEAARAGELLSHDMGRFRRLVADLLEVSRLDAGAEPLHHEEFDLVAFLRSVASTRDAEVSLTSPRSLPVVSDRVGWERIIGNLVENAARHGGGGVVDVTITADEGQVSVTVRDDGPGIEADDLERVFDRFWKKDPARSGKGSGLGLAIARDHARRLGGDIVARVPMGRGAELVATVPVTRPLPAGDASDTDGSDPESTA